MKNLKRAETGKIPVEVFIHKKNYCTLGVTEAI
jgi:hypothetical protein